MSGQAAKNFEIGRDGAVLRKGPLYEKFFYELSNKKVLAQADGCCSVSRYAVANRFDVFVPGSFYAALSINGKGLAADTQKSVSMLGRTQKIEIALSGETGSRLLCETFLDEATQAVFQQYKLLGAQKGAFAEGKKQLFRLDFGFLLAGASIGLYLGKEPLQTPYCTRHNRGWSVGAFDGWDMAVVSNSPLILREVLGMGLHFSAALELSVCEDSCLRMVYRMNSSAGQDDAAALLDCFDRAYEDSQKYSLWLAEISEGHEGVEKAQFAASVNCGLSNYKEIDDFKGFFAGVNYSFPARTYYRDGFFTALAVLSWRPEWAAEQIRTLALGIGEDGGCPSAVIDAGKVFWPDHFDSPQYFVLLLYEYVQHTGNVGFLETKVKGRSLFEWAELITLALLEKTDANGLLWRESGRRRDWADNVFREGYVTYVEALFCQSVRCMGKMSELAGKKSGTNFEEKADSIAGAIDRHLWDEELGWYVNYSGENYVEKNLSIDTVLLAWFGIAPEDRAKRMLFNMENLLETANNTLQPFGDWGVMCCWPPYGKKEHLVEKSSYDYVYHNGSDWPFWSCIYAMARQKYGMKSRYPATRWFEYGLENGWNTPVEYCSPAAGRGSNLQAWSALGADALLNIRKGE